MKSIYAVVGLVLEHGKQIEFENDIRKRYSIKQYRLVDITDGSIIDVDKSDYESLLWNNKIYLEDLNLLSFTNVDIDKYGEASPVACTEVCGKIFTTYDMNLAPSYHFCYSLIIDGKTVYKATSRCMELGRQKLDYGLYIRLVYDHKDDSIFLNIGGFDIKPFNIGYCNSYPIGDLDFINKMDRLVMDDSYAVNLTYLLDSIQVLSNGCIYMNDICILTGESAGDIIISNDAKTLVVGDLSRKVDSRLNSLVVPPSIENVICSEFRFGRYDSNTKLYLSSKLSRDAVAKICGAVLGLTRYSIVSANELDDCLEFY